MNKLSKLEQDKKIQEFYNITKKIDELLERQRKILDTIAYKKDLNKDMQGEDNGRNSIL